MTTKIKITNGASKEELLENFYQDLKDAGYRDVMVIAVPEDNHEVLSMFKVDGIKAMAMIGMQIKFLAEATDNDSVELAKIITKNLKRTEEEVGQRLDFTIKD
jgi:hypothetical protein